MMETVILSLGGSLICPENIDVTFLQQFKQLLSSFPKKRFALICGGGHICRVYQKAAKELGVASSEELDWIGIKATKLNAELVRTLFGKEAYETVIDNPEQKIKTNKQIVIGSGYIPGSSSDLDAVHLAKNLGAKTVINLSNIDYLYDKDPKQFSDAQKIVKATFKQLLEITGKEWVPGKNVPFDPAASKQAMIAGITVVLMNGKNLDNLKNYLDGKKFVGSVIE
ncbi:UMP kinase [Candidatus Woesearchaeota archaeon]|nr:UMP kinase [Candidatus Woesearchaeota archaeon]